ncbi:MAG: efflux RND transporter permease subunit [Pseudomonadota bacterium]
MTGIVDWAAGRARMILAFVVLSLVAGWTAYTGLPKEGEPDIDVPVLIVSAPFPGVSAEDSEKLLVRPLEQELQDLEGVKEITATAAEGIAIVVLEFEFGWEKNATIADTRDKVDRAAAGFPSGADSPTISEINFSEFPIIVVSLSGNVPERALFRVASDLQSELESLPEVLEAGLAGSRDEMVEVLINPLRLEAYNVTAQELASVVINNNQLVAGGSVETGSGAFSLKVPGSFETTEDVYNLPVKVNGDRVITLGDLASIRLTFEDPIGTARFNGEPTVALQVVKRKGVNLIDTVALVKETISEVEQRWSPELQQAIHINYSMDMSREVGSMVSQLEGSVMTAVILVMIVVLAALGIRSALLVGFAIPTSFLLAFALFAVLDFTVSNIVMFGLILAVGILVDGAIVVVEYADKRIRRGDGPMQAYSAAAKRMFWPIVSSTATTLCAFLPMLFWPGIAGEFMGMLPITLIFVLTASLLVALVYLPVVGGVSGRLTRTIDNGAAFLRHRYSRSMRAIAFVLAASLFVISFTGRGAVPAAALPLTILMFASVVALVFLILSFKRDPRQAPPKKAGYQRTQFGHLIHSIVGNPVMPFVTIIGVLAFSFYTVAVVFPQYSRGVEFFVATEPERAVAYVRARGNLSLDEKDRLVRAVENEVLQTPGISSVFAFAGNGGLNQAGDAGSVPNDTVGQIQIELENWEIRGPNTGHAIIADAQARADRVPGVIVEISEQAGGPGSGKPVFLRVTGANQADLLQATALARAKFDSTPGLIDIEDSRPLPGIDWRIDVDVEAAGRYGADVATVGSMIQLVTQGILLDTMRTDTSDEEVEIRVRFPEDQRLLSTIDTMRVRTAEGLVPLSNFVTRTAVPRVAQIERINSQRYFDIMADVEGELVKITEASGDDATPDTIIDVLPASAAATRADEFAEAGYTITPVTPTERIGVLQEWLDSRPFPDSVFAEWTGDQADQEESGAFLMQAMLGALGLMFVILLAQFNSVYNSVAVLLAVIFSVTGVLIGMMLLGQTFSIIMTGTGIVALAGVVVNNNIVLIDTYQEYRQYMPKLEAIVRTAEARIRPVFLTTVTTIAGLTPMVIGVSIDFGNGGYTLDAPTALWWKQLATAVVFGLGTATILTLVFTPAVLAARVWFEYAVLGRNPLHGAMTAEQRENDRALQRAARSTRDIGEFDWSIMGLEPAGTAPKPRKPKAPPSLSAAE